MRRTGRLLLAAILILIIAVGAIYFIRQKSLRAHPLAQPKSLRPGVVASAEDGWSYSQTDSVTGRPIVEVHAHSFEQTQEPPQTQLQEVEIRLFKKDSAAYDEVKSAKATFIESEKKLFSDGEVEIRMAVPVDGPPKGRLVSIKSSGVTFFTDTGKASTDRAATFAFEGGEGKSVGAEYDPTTHILHLKSAVELNSQPRGPKAKPMKIETGDLYYQELESRITLGPWSRLTRDTLKVEGGSAIVALDDGVVRTVDAQTAHGVDTYPTRSVEFQAQRILMTMDDDGVAKQVNGEREARLVSRGAAGETAMTGDKVDLDFDTSHGESQLTKALAQGHAVVTSNAAAQKGQPAPETRIMRSEILFIEMQPGGHEIRQAVTLRPGDVEFVPNSPGQRHRFIHGEQLTLSYASRNRIERFQARQSTTLTDPLPRKTPPKPGQPPPAPSITSSDDFLANFDPRTGQMKTIDQTGNFHYQEGARKASAQHATLDSARDLITLKGAARMWDDTGSAAANQIDLDQKTGDFVAEGKVTSTRLPDQKAGSGGPAMLKQDQAVQALADKMTSREQNTLIVYEGNAVLWQEGNRVQGDRVEINRDEQTLDARGRVITRMVDNPKQPGAKPETAVFTVVQAPRMVYSDDEKMANYTGGVILVRPGMNIRAKEIRAFLKEGKDGSSLDKSLADGEVQIVQSLPDRVRRGVAEHAEYYVSEDRVVLHGGQPRLHDSIRGETAGQRLTYFSKNDRLVVEGAVKQPGLSTLHQKKKKSK